MQQKVAIARGMPGRARPCSSSMSRQRGSTTLSKLNVQEFVEEVRATHGHDDRPDHA